MRWDYPQPFEELDHTADIGVVVRGASADETLARLVLALTSVATGGGPARAAETVAVTAPPGDRVAMAIDLLRELLYRYDKDGALPASCEVERFDERDGAAIKVGLAPYDADAHAEGIDIKAVTWHAARFEREGEGWIAQIVFDV